MLSITVVSFTVESDCSLLTREDISGYFVEFQLLDYDYGELETPSVFTLPHSAHPVVFNHRTGTGTCKMHVCCDVCNNGLHVRVCV